MKKIFTYRYEIFKKFSITPSAEKGYQNFSSYKTITL